jgi:DNA-binding transcriptional LysR family regulator
MDSRFLHTFVVVVERGSIAEAARQLGLTPTSVTQRLRSLEEDVGSLLIVRSGRTVKPTVAGLRIMERARVILREVRDLKSEASDTHLPAGPLRIGATPTALTGIFPPILKRWVARHPDIEIFIEPASTNLLYSRVMNGELDAAILVHPLFTLPKTCEWRSVREERLILLTPADMRVLDPLETVMNEHFILYDRNVVAGKLAHDYLTALGVHPKVRFELDGIESIAKLVSEGLGVSVLPDWPVIGPVVANLRRWELPVPCPSRTVGALWLRSSVRSPLVQAFVEMAGEHGG